MSDENLPPSKPETVAATRQRKTVYFSCALLVSYAVILLLVPTPKLSMTARVFLAAGNLIAAAILWLLTRQKFGGK